MSKRNLALLGLTACALFLFTGCGDDEVSTRPTPSITDRTPYVPPRPAAHPILATLPPPDTSTDPLAAPDGLLGSSMPAAGAILPADDAGNTPPATPDDSDDPLASAPDTLAGQTPGIKMPTDHSHWLKGPIFNARIVVRVNGLYLGTYSSPQDRDITMKMRSGINTVTLAYTPLTSTASAQLDILEGEHDPPLVPLATFRSERIDSGSPAALQTTTQNLTFLAR